MIYLTSDWHLGHTNILHLQNRPFESTYEMNETIVENYCSVVNKNDTVYFLGDIGLCSPKYLNTYLQRLPGHKVLVPGNHDKAALNHFNQSQWEQIVPLLELHHNKNSITMCHYPMRSWKHIGRGAYHFHGHWHTQDHSEYRARIGSMRMMDIGVDGWAYKPLLLDTAISILKEHHFTYD